MKEIELTWGFLDDDLNEDVLYGEIWVAQITGNYIGFAVDDSLMYTAVYDKPFTKAEFQEKIRILQSVEEFFLDHVHDGFGPIPVPPEENIKILSPSELDHDIYWWAVKQSGWKL